MSIAVTREQGTLTPNKTPNYFGGSEIAERYHRARPLYHAEVVRWICAATGQQSFACALDVGCGSGHSTMALAEIAEQVIGVDASPEMLQQAQAGERIRYQPGRAEELEFASGEFDLVTVGSALHWFAQDRFYAECKKVMARDGALVVYNDHFTAHMQGSVECKRWMRTRFAKRFPPPRRGMRDIDESKAVQCGFRVEKRGSFSHQVRFTRDEFVAYLLTRSNTLAAVEAGRESLESIAVWLHEELAGIVPEPYGEFVFKCNLWLLRGAESGLLHG